MKQLRRQASFSFGATFLLCLLISCGGSTDSPVKDFFEQFDGGDGTSYLSYYSPIFYEQISKEQWKTVLKKFHDKVGPFKDIKIIGLDERNLASGLAEPAGEYRNYECDITYENGFSREKIEFHRGAESDDFLIVSHLMVPTTVLISTLEVPSISERRVLVITALEACAHAVDSDDFSAFHSSLSKFLKGRYPPEALKKSFAHLSGRSADILKLIEGDPADIVTPKVDGRGSLVLVGSFADGALHYNLEFIYEDEWKVMGINVEVR